MPPLGAVSARQSLACRQSVFMARGSQAFQPNTRNISVTDSVPTNRPYNRMAIEEMSQLGSSLSFQMAPQPGQDFGVFYVYPSTDSQSIDGRVLSNSSGNQDNSEDIDLSVTSDERRLSY